MGAVGLKTTLAEAAVVRVLPEELPELNVPQAGETDQSTLVSEVPLFTVLADIAAELPPSTTVEEEACVTHARVVAFTG
jgi:hypothetical protein